MQVSIAVLIGVPAAGKTTFSNCLKAEECPATVIHVNFDNLLPFKNFRETKSWNEERRTIMGNVENFIKAAKAMEPFVVAPWGSYNFSPEEKLVIIVDDNMYLRSMRLRYYRLAREYGCGFLQVYFNISLEEALSNNRLRPKDHFVPEPIIKTMLEELDKPDPRENSWETNTLLIDCPFDFQSVKELFYERLEGTFEHPERPQVAAPINPPHPRNIIHETDIILRKLISREMLDAKGREMDLSAVSKELARIKSLLLDGVKSGTLIVPSSVPLETFVQSKFCELLNNKSNEIQS